MPTSHIAHRLTWNRCCGFFYEVTTSWYSKAAMCPRVANLLHFKHACERSLCPLTPSLLASLKEVPSKNISFHWIEVLRYSRENASFFSLSPSPSLSLPLPHTTLPKAGASELPTAIHHSLDITFQQDSNVGTALSLIVLCIC